MPASWTPDQRGEALWALIVDEINRLDPTQYAKSHAALVAAFRLDGPLDRSAGNSIPARIADDLGVTRDSAQNSWSHGVWRLGWRLDSRLREFAEDRDRWLLYTAVAPLELSSHSDAQHMFVERLVATHIMSGRAIDRSTTERLVTATEDGVDRYIVRATSPSGGPDAAKVVNLLNCQAGNTRLVPDGRGGQIQEVPMIFPNRLLAGEQLFFASEVTSQHNEEPIVEAQVTSQGIQAGGLTIRIQFDRDNYPRAVWWFGDTIDARRLDKPSDDDEHRLMCTPFGYLEHTFAEVCKPLAKYGIAWEWDD